MEVVVKLNQFPDDVTVDLGRLEFVVDTGEALVTITVKPKVFAAWSRHNKITWTG